MITGTYLIFITGMGCGVFYQNTVYSLIAFPVSGVIELKFIQLFKIIFNITGGIRLNMDIIYLILRGDVSNSLCNTIAFIQAVVFLLYRTSLMLCLFYKVKLIYKHESVKAFKGLLGFGLLLISIRIGFNLAHILLLKPEVQNGICKANSMKSQVTSWGFISTDFIIEVYLAISMINVLIKTKRKEESSKFDNSFNAVIVWCLTRISLAISLNLITVLTTVNISVNNNLVPTLNFFICILMSYSLTYDKDITRFIRRHLN